MEILSLGEKIKRKRKELNMTLKDLAGDRITPGQISLVESGRSNPSMDLLEYLATTLNTSVEYLMESEKTQAERFCLYFEQSAERFILDANLSKSEQYIETALYYAEKYDLEYRMAKNFYLKAEVYLLQDKYEIAQQWFLSASLLFIKTNSHVELVNTYLKVAKISLKIKGYYSANSYLKEAEKIYVNNNLTEDLVLGEIYYYLSKTYFLMEDIETAIRFSFLAKLEFEKIYDKKKYAKTLALLGEQYKESGDLQNAITYSRKSLDIYKGLKQKENVANIENSLGKLFSEFNNLEESFDHYERAKKIRIDIKDKKTLDTFINICENYIKLKDVSKCEDMLQEMKNYMDIDDAESFIDYNLLKARVEMLKESKEDAEGTLLYTLRIAEKNGLEKRKAEISISLGRFYLELKRDYEAAKYLDDGVNSLRKVGVIKN